MFGRDMQYELLQHGTPRKHRSRGWDRVMYGVAALLLACSLSIVFRQLFASSARALAPQQAHWTPGIDNTTLGFGDIYVIGLADRNTRHDELVLMAQATDIRLTYIDAVAGDTLQNSSLPYIGNRVPLSRNELGCWRSHINAWKQMLDSNVETALFFEDDVDWSMGVRKQLSRFAPALAQKQGLAPSTSDTQHPYRGDWEVLWFGSCNERALDIPQADWDAGDLEKHFTQYADDSVGPASESHPRWAGILDKYHVPKEGYRVIQRADTPSCLSGYALSRRGAARLYYKLTRQINYPVDAEVYYLALHGEIKAYSLVPPIMAQWKIKNGHNSDLRNQGSGATPWNPSQGHADDVGATDSVRHNLGRLIDEM